MDRGYDEMLEKLGSLSNKARDLKDFNEFMAKVDEIESIVKGFCSKDENIVDKSLERADKFLANHEKAKEVCHKDNDFVIDDEDNCSRKKKTFSKTVINDRAFKGESVKTTERANEMSPDEFMKTVEEDAKKRAEDRKKRKEKAKELKIKAESEFNSGDYDVALETYNEAISLVRDWAALYSGRAQTHLQLGNIMEAMSDCDWAFKADKNSLNAHMTQGKVYMAARRYNKAVNLFQKAINLKPNKKSLIEGYLKEAMEMAQKKDPSKEFTI